MHINSKNILVHADTNIVYVKSFLLISRSRKYNSWYEDGGINASKQCQMHVARFFCMEIFPPCKSPSDYAVYPCKQECNFLEKECGVFSPFDCPLDGPGENSLIPAKGKHINSNNGFQSCFTPNATIIPYPLLLLIIFFNYYFSLFRCIFFMY